MLNAIYALVNGYQRGKCNRLAEFKFKTMSLFSVLSLSFSCQLTGKVNTLIFREYQYSWYNIIRVDFRNNRWTKPASWSLLWPICNWSMRGKLACHNQYLISHTSNVPLSQSRLNFRLSWWACMFSQGGPLLWTLIGAKFYPGPHVEPSLKMLGNWPVSLPVQ